MNVMRKLGHKVYYYVMNFPKYQKKLLFGASLDKALLVYTCSESIHETIKQSLKYAQS